MKLTALAEEQKLELIKRYQAGESGEAIAPDFGLTGAGVRWILKEKGIPVRDKLTAQKIRRHKQLTTPPPDNEDGSEDTPDDDDSDDKTLPLKPQNKPSEYQTKHSAKTALSFDEASVVAFIPKEFKANSLLLSVAKAVTEKEWLWPRLDIGDWLDSYLYYTMLQRGIVLGSYTVLDKKAK